MNPNELTARNIVAAIAKAIEDGRLTIHEDGYVDTVHGTLTVTVTVHPGEVRRLATW